VNSEAARTARREITMIAGGLGGLLNFSVPDASGTDTQTPGGALHHGPDGLQVHIPATLRDIMSVADAVSELWAAATDFTFFGHKTGISSELQKHSVAGRILRCHIS
jgi:hypothetical protein